MASLHCSSRHQPVVRLEGLLGASEDRLDVPESVVISFPKKKKDHPGNSRSLASSCSGASLVAVSCARGRANGVNGEGDPGKKEGEPPKG